MRHKTGLRASRILAAVTGDVRRVAVLVLILAGSTSAGAQEYRGTQDQRVACTGDVFKLCWSEIPSVSRIVGCLEREKPRLSAGCRAVFDQNTRTASNHWQTRHHRLASSAAATEPMQYEHHEVAAPIAVASTEPLPVATSASQLAAPQLKDHRPKAASRAVRVKGRMGRMLARYLAGRGLHASRCGVDAIHLHHHMAHVMKDKCLHRTVAARSHNRFGS
jgi:hypothetical protein